LRQAILAVLVLDIQQTVTKHLIRPAKPLVFAIQQRVMSVQRGLHALTELALELAHLDHLAQPQNSAGIVQHHITLTALGAGRAFKKVT
jgi:hypothetical protein